MNREGGVMLIKDSRFEANSMPVSCSSINGDLFIGLNVWGNRAEHIYEHRLGPHAQLTIVRCDFIQNRAGADGTRAHN